MNNIAPTIPFHDSLHRLAQVGAAAGLQLVRITALDSGNRYTAGPVEFDSQGATQFADESTLTVTNLAEPADAPGNVPSGTDAVALDVEGRWVVFVRAAAGEAPFAAKVTASLGQARYTVRRQIATGEGAFADKDAIDLTACNLAELSLGTGAAVDLDTIVLVTDLGEGSGAARYVFDHPAYAKYLD
jgi:hypothetical protein